MTKAYVKVVLDNGGGKVAITKQEVEVPEIDNINLSPRTREAMRAAMEKLGAKIPEVKP